ncbi:GGDEF domain-containing protein [Paenibacillus odorifer]|uniref:GGDEF domain-containing protein n=1 Tax=Paenibacillus odorifer TaxID=189426 RepID=UPI0009D69A18|nr:GGDEF domain-containing protein [Paenibacillus odorifer]
MCELKVVEVQIYLQTLMSIIIAGVVGYLVLRFYRDVASKEPKQRAVYTGLSIITIVVGLWAMHQLGKKSLEETVEVNGGIFTPLLIYALTIAVLMFLLTRLNLVLAEREQLKELAYKDGLTGLLNKNGMDHFWDRCKVNEQLAVLFMDLNRFKSINDSLGHHVGDLLLQEVGGRLSQFSSKRKRHIFRIGGDEFVIVAKGCNQKEAEQLAVQILEKTTRHYQLGEHNLFVSASIGISISHDKVDHFRLLHEADTAMYTAKQLGTGRYSVYKN